MDVLEPYPAYCLDEAVSMFGSACERVMEEARNSGGNKSKKTDAQRQAAAENALRKMLDLPQKFRSLTELGRA